MHEPATLGALVDVLGGQLEPDDAATRARRVLGACSIERPRPQHVAALESARLRSHAARFDGAALIVGVDDSSIVATPAGCPLWRHPSPAAALDRVADRLRRHRPDLPTGVAESAIVAADAELAGDVSIGHHAVIARAAALGAHTAIGPGAIIDTGARLGARCHIGAGAYIGPGCTLGDDVHVGPNTVIGSPGFGYRVAELGPGGKGAARRPHVAAVVIEDDVHIGASVTIDAGRLEPTRVGAGSRIDNLVHLAHNVRLGARCWVLAQAGIAGSTVLEDDCALGGQAGIAGHLTLGAGSQVAAQAGVGRSLPAGRQVAGSPAYELSRWRRVSVLERELHTRYRQIDALEQRMSALEQQLSELGPGNGS